MDTLYNIINGRLDEKQKDVLARKLLLLQLLNQLQLDICNDVQRELSAVSAYRFTIRHNHEKVMALIRKNYMDCFKNEKQIDMFCDNADELTRLIYRWAGIDEKIL